MSLFLVTLLVLTIFGWQWAGGQPSPKCEGARVALALCCVAVVGTLFLLWREKQPEMT